MQECEERIRIEQMVLADNFHRRGKLLYLDERDDSFGGSKLSSGYFEDSDLGGFYLS